MRSEGRCEVAETTDGRVMVDVDRGGHLVRALLTPEHARRLARELEVSATIAEAGRWYNCSECRSEAEVASRSGE